LEMFEEVTENKEDYINSMKPLARISSLESMKILKIELN